MILVDTSIWIDHLRSRDKALTDLLESGRVLTHAGVVGEVALGFLGHRDRVLEALQNLPQAITASDGEVLVVINKWKLFGTGIGYLDAHLIAAIMLTPDALLWTRDKRLRAISERLHLQADLD